MNSRELRNLQEAYLDVYYDLDEASGGIIGGRLFPRKKQKLSLKDKLTDIGDALAGVPVGYSRSKRNRRSGPVEIPQSVRAAWAQKNRPQHRRTAKNRLEKVDGQWRKTKVEEALELILLHLLDEGYTDTVEGAEVILENMSDEWLEDIVEAKYGTKKGRHALAMKIRHGEDIGKKNVPGKTGFKAVAAKARRAGARNPEAVAAAAMWKKHGG